MEDMSLVFDDAQVRLFAGMKNWVSNPETGWDDIVGSLSDLIEIAGLSNDDIEKLTSQYSEELGYSDDNVMDLDASVRNWLDNN